MNILRRVPPILCALLATPFAGLFGAAAPKPEPFAFAALGCMPYARSPGATPAFVRVITEINRHRPAFTVHLGDILGSDERCTDEIFLQRQMDFNSFEGALVYTPGDNEWTDTYKPAPGKYDPAERLAKVRAMFFAEERSLGASPIPLVTQRRDARYAKFVENARWSVSGVMFATVHVVGSSNNHLASVPGAMEEWRERDEANAAWIKAAFAEARAQSAPGIALFFQADPFASDKNKGGYAEGFEQFLKVTEQEARAFAKPVLLVHADEHRYRLDRPMRFEASAAPVPNVTRLETFGGENFHAVLVTVDPESPEVFLTAPLIIPGNRLPVLPRPKAAK